MTSVGKIGEEGDHGLTMEEQSLLNCKTGTLSGLPRLSGEFNRGYSKAIMDMQKEMKDIQRDLRDHKRNLNYKLCMDALQLFLENRENFREGMNGFIRYNTKAKELEFFTPERKTKS